MTTTDSQLQLMTFMLGQECYGIDIMDVKEIHQVQTVRPIPGAPNYVMGVFNLRGVVIPVIDLSKRFFIESGTTVEKSKTQMRSLSGFVVIQIDNTLVGIAIERVLKIVSVEAGEIRVPPTVLAGVGSEYVRGVVYTSGEGYLIILDIRRVFDVEEVRELKRGVGRV